MNIAITKSNAVDAEKQAQLLKYRIDLDAFVKERCTGGNCANIELMLAAMQLEVAWLVCAGFIEAPDSQAERGDITHAVMENLQRGVAMWLDTLPTDPESGRRIFKP